MAFLLLLVQFLCFFFLLYLYTYYLISFLISQYLYNLINTITINEVKTEKTEEKPIEPLDLFEDLKGDENTEVFEGIKEEIKKISSLSSCAFAINEFISYSFVVDSGTIDGFSSTVGSILMLFLFVVSLY